MSDVVFFIIAEAEEIYKTILKFNWAGEDAAGMASGRWVSHALSAGADLVEATQCYRVQKIRYAFNAPFIKNCGRFNIGLPETRSGRDKAIPI